MLTHKKERVYVFVRKIVSSTLLLTFLFTNSDVVLAKEIFNNASEKSTLSPTSRFKPIGRVEPSADGYKISKNPSALAALTDDFKSDVGQWSLNYLIGDALYLKLSADGLIALIERDLPNIKFNNLDYHKVYEKDGSFYLPYIRNDIGENIFLRYFKIDGNDALSKYESTPPADRKVLDAPDIVKIHVGGDRFIGMEVVETAIHRPPSVPLTGSYIEPGGEGGGVGAFEGVEVRAFEKYGREVTVELLVKKAGRKSEKVVLRGVEESPHILRDFARTGIAAVDGAIDGFLDANPEIDCVRIKEVEFKEGTGLKLADLSAISARRISEEGRKTIPFIAFLGDLTGSRILRFHELGHLSDIPLKAILDNIKDGKIKEDLYDKKTNEDTLRSVRLHHVLRALQRDRFGLNDERLSGVIREMVVEIPDDVQLVRYSVDYAAHKAVECAKKSEYVEAAAYWETAATLCCKAKRFIKAAKYKIRAAINWTFAAKQAQEKGQFQDSIAYAKNAIELEEGLSDWPHMAISVSVKAFSYKMSGDFHNAGIYDRSAAELDMKIGHIMYAVEHYIYAALNFKEAERPEDENDCNNKAVKILKDVARELQPDISNADGVFAHLVKEYPDNFPELIRERLKELIERALASLAAEITPAANEVAAVELKGADASIMSTLLGLKAAGVLYETKLRVAGLAGVNPTTLYNSARRNPDTIGEMLDEVTSMARAVVRARDRLIAGGKADIRQADIAREIGVTNGAITRLKQRDEKIKKELGTLPSSDNRRQAKSGAASNPPATGSNLSPQMKEELTGILIDAFWLSSVYAGGIPVISHAALSIASGIPIVSPTTLSINIKGTAEEVRHGLAELREAIVKNCKFIGCAPPPHRSVMKRIDAFLTAHRVSWILADIFGPKIIVHDIDTVLADKGRRIKLTAKIDRDENFISDLRVFAERLKERNLEGEALKKALAELLDMMLSEPGRIADSAPPSPPKSETVEQKLLRLAASVLESISEDSTKIEKAAAREFLTALSGSISALPPYIVRAFRFELQQRYAIAAANLSPEGLACVHKGIAHSPGSQRSAVRLAQAMEIALTKYVPGQEIKFTTAKDELWFLASEYVSAWNLRKEADEERLAFAQKFLAELFLALPRDGSGDGILSGLQIENIEIGIRKEHKQFGNLTREYIQRLLSQDLNVENPAKAVLHKTYAIAYMVCLVIAEERRQVNALNLVNRPDKAPETPRDTSAKKDLVNLALLVMGSVRDAGAKEIRVDNKRADTFIEALCAHLGSLTPVEIEAIEAYQRSRLGGPGPRLTAGNIARIKPVGDNSVMHEIAFTLAKAVEHTLAEKEYLDFDRLDFEGALKILVKDYGPRVSALGGNAFFLHTRRYKTENCGRIGLKMLWAAHELGMEPTLSPESLAAQLANRHIMKVDIIEKSTGPPFLVLTLEQPHTRLNNTATKTVVAYLLKKPMLPIVEPLPQPEERLLTPEAYGEYFETDPEKLRPLVWREDEDAETKIARFSQLMNLAERGFILLDEESMLNSEAGAKRFISMVADPEERPQLETTLLGNMRPGWARYEETTGGPEGRRNILLLNKTIAVMNYIGIGDDLTNERADQRLLRLAEAIAGSVQIRPMEYLCRALITQNEKRKRFIVSDEDFDKIVQAISSEREAVQAYLDAANECADAISDPEEKKRFYAAAAAYFAAALPVGELKNIDILTLRNLVVNVSTLGPRMVAALLNNSDFDMAERLIGAFSGIVQLMPENVAARFDKEFREATIREPFDAVKERPAGLGAYIDTAVVMIIKSLEEWLARDYSELGRLLNIVTPEDYKLEASKRTVPGKKGKGKRPATLDETKQLVEQDIQNIRKRIGKVIDALIETGLSEEDVERLVYGPMIEPLTADKAVMRQRLDSLLERLRGKAEHKPKGLSGSDRESLLSILAEFDKAIETRNAPAPIEEGVASDPEATLEAPAIEAVAKAPVEDTNPAQVLQAPAANAPAEPVPAYQKEPPAPIPPVPAETIEERLLKLASTVVDTFSKGPGNEAEGVEHAKLFFRELAAHIEKLPPKSIRAIRFALQQDFGLAVPDISRKNMIAIAKRLSVGDKSSREAALLIASGVKAAFKEGGIERSGRSKHPLDELRFLAAEYVPILDPGKNINTQTIDAAKKFLEAINEYLPLNGEGDGILPKELIRDIERTFQKLCDDKREITGSLTRAYIRDLLQCLNDGKANSKAKRDAVGMAYTIAFATAQAITEKGGGEQAIRALFSPLQENDAQPPAEPGAGRRAESLPISARLFMSSHQEREEIDYTKLDFAGALEAQIQQYRKAVPAMEKGMLVTIYNRPGSMANNNLIGLRSLWASYELGLEPSYIEEELALYLAACYPESAQLLFDAGQNEVPPALVMNLEKPYNRINLDKTKEVRIYILKKPFPPAGELSLTPDQYKEYFEWDKDVVGNLAWQVSDTADIIVQKVVKILELAQEGRLLLDEDFLLRTKAGTERFVLRILENEAERSAVIEGLTKAYERRQASYDEKTHGRETRLEDIPVIKTILSFHYRGLAYALSDSAMRGRLIALIYPVRGETIIAPIESFCRAFLIKDNEKKRWMVSDRDFERAIAEPLRGSPHLEAMPVYMRITAELGATIENERARNRFFTAAALWWLRTFPLEKLKNIDRQGLENLIVHAGSLGAEEALPFVAHTGLNTAQNLINAASGILTKMPGDAVSKFHSAAKKISGGISYDKIKERPEDLGAYLDPIITFIINNLECWLEDSRKDISRLLNIVTQDEWVIEVARRAAAVSDKKKRKSIDIAAAKELVAKDITQVRERIRMIEEAFAEAGFSQADIDQLAVPKKGSDNLDGTNIRRELQAVLAMVKGETPPAERQPAKYTQARLAQELQDIDGVAAAHKAYLAGQYEESIKLSDGLAGVGSPYNEVIKRIRGMAEIELAAMERERDLARAEALLEELEGTFVSWSTGLERLPVVAALRSLLDKSEESELGRRFSRIMQEKSGIIDQGLTTRNLVKEIVSLLRVVKDTVVSADTPEIVSDEAVRANEMIGNLPEPYKTRFMGYYSSIMEYKRAQIAAARQEKAALDAREQAQREEQERIIQQEEEARCIREAEEARERAAAKLSEKLAQARAGINQSVLAAFYLLGTAKELPEEIPQLEEARAAISELRSLSDDTKERERLGIFRYALHIASQLRTPQGMEVVPKEHGQITKAAFDAVRLIHAGQLLINRETEPAIMLGYHRLVTMATNRIPERTMEKQGVWGQWMNFLKETERGELVKGSSYIAGRAVKVAEAKNSAELDGYERGVKPYFDDYPGLYSDREYLLRYWEAALRAKRGQFGQTEQVRPEAPEPAPAPKPAPAPQPGPSFVDLAGLTRTVLARDSQYAGLAEIAHDAFVKELSAMCHMDIPVETLVCEWPKPFIIFMIDTSQITNPLRSYIMRERSAFREKIIKALPPEETREIVTAILMSDDKLAEVEGIAARAESAVNGIRSNQTESMEIGSYSGKGLAIAEALIRSVNRDDERDLYLERESRPDGRTTLILKPLRATRKKADVTRAPEVVAAIPGDKPDFVARDETKTLGARKKAAKGRRGLQESDEMTGAARRPAVQERAKISRKTIRILYPFVPLEEITSERIKRLSGDEWIEKEVALVRDEFGSVLEETFIRRAFANHAQQMAQDMAAFKEWENIGVEERQNRLREVMINRVLTLYPIIDRSALVAMYETGTIKAKSGDDFIKDETQALMARYTFLKKEKVETVLVTHREKARLDSAYYERYREMSDEERRGRILATLFMGTPERPDYISLILRSPAKVAVPGLRKQTKALTTGEQGKALVFSEVDDLLKECPALDRVWLDRTVVKVLNIGDWMVVSEELWKDPAAHLANAGNKTPGMPDIKPEYSAQANMSFEDVLAGFEREVKAKHEDITGSIIAYCLALPDESIKERVFAIRAMLERLEGDTDKDIAALAHKTHVYLCSRLIWEGKLEPVWGRELRGDVTFTPEIYAWLYGEYVYNFNMYGDERYLRHGVEGANHLIEITINAIFLAAGIINENEKTFLSPIVNILWGESYEIPIEAADAIISKKDPKELELCKRFYIAANLIQNDMAVLMRIYSIKGTGRFDTDDMKIVLTYLWIILSSTDEKSYAEMLKQIYVDRSLKIIKAIILELQDIGSVMKELALDDRAFPGLLKKYNDEETTTQVAHMLAKLTLSSDTAAASCARKVAVKLDHKLPDAHILAKMRAITISVPQPGQLAVPHIKEAMEMAQEMPLPESERKATLRINKDLIGNLSQRDLDKITAILIKNYDIQENARSLSVELDDPITVINGKKLKFPIKYLQVKGVVFDSSKELEFHNGQGNLDYSYIPDENGIIQKKPFFGMPQGGLYLEEAVNEFVKTSDMINNPSFNGLLVPKYPLGWGRFETKYPFCDKEGLRHDLGFVILGGSANNMYRGGFNAEATGRALRILHQNGYAHHYMHSQNITFFADDDTGFIHDLDGLKNWRDGMTKEKMLAYQFIDFWFALMKQTMIQDGLLGYRKSLLLRLNAFVLGYFPDDRDLFKDITYEDIEKVLSEAGNKPIQEIDNPAITLLKRNMEIDGIADWGLGYYKPASIESEIRVIGQVRPGEKPEYSAQANMSFEDVLAGFEREVKAWHEDITESIIAYCLALPDESIKERVFAIRAMLERLEGDTDKDIAALAHKTHVYLCSRLIWEGKLEPVWGKGLKGDVTFTPEVYAWLYREYVYNAEIDKGFRYERHGVEGLHRLVDITIEAIFGLAGITDKNDRALLLPAVTYRVWDENEPQGEEFNRRQQAAISGIISKKGQREVVELCVKFYKAGWEIRNSLNAFALTCPSVSYYDEDLGRVTEGYFESSDVGEILGGGASWLKEIIKETGRVEEIGRKISIDGDLMCARAAISILHSSEKALLFLYGGPVFKGLLRYYNDESTVSQVAQALAELALSPDAAVASCARETAVRLDRELPDAQILAKVREIVEQHERAMVAVRSLVHTALFDFKFWLMRLEDPNIPEIKRTYDEFYQMYEKANNGYISPAETWQAFIGWRKALSEASSKIAEKVDSAEINLVKGYFKRLIDAIDDRLAFVEARSGLQDNVEINKIVEKVNERIIDENSDIYKERIHLTLAPAVLATANPLALQSAIYNIMQNVIDLKILDREAGALKVLGVIEDGKFVLKFFDNGPGIPQDGLEIDPFTGRQRIFNLDWTRRKGGTGLGLCETWYAVHDHGGMIEADSLTKDQLAAMSKFVLEGRARQGKRTTAGTTFTIRLPINGARDEKHIPRISVTDIIPEPPPKDMLRMQHCVKYAAFPGMVFPSRPGVPMAGLCERHIIYPFEEYAVANEAEPDTIVWHDLHSDDAHFFINDDGEVLQAGITNPLTISLYLCPKVTDVIIVGTKHFLGGIKGSLNADRPDGRFALYSSGHYVSLVPAENVPDAKGGEVLRYITFHYKESLNDIAQDELKGKKVFYHLDIDALTPREPVGGMSIPQYLSAVQRLRGTAAEFPLVTLATSPAQSDLRMSHGYILGFLWAWGYKEDVEGCVRGLIASGKADESVKYLSEIIARENMKVRAEGEVVPNEVKWAVILRDTIRARVGKASKQEEKLFIGVELKKLLAVAQDDNRHKHALQHLLSEIHNLKKQVHDAGLEKYVEFGWDKEGDELAEAAAKSGAKPGNTIILADKDTLVSNIFGELLKGAILAGVDMSDLLKKAKEEKVEDEAYYIRLAEMLTIALELSFESRNINNIKAIHNGSIDIDDTTMIAKGIILLIPKSVRKRYEELEETYNLQAAPLSNA